MVIAESLELTGEVTRVGPDFLKACLPEFVCFLLLHRAPYCLLGWLFVLEAVRKVVCKEARRDCLFKLAFRSSALDQKSATYL